MGSRLRKYGEEKLMKLKRKEEIREIKKGNSRMKTSEEEFEEIGEI